MRGGLGGRLRGTVVWAALLGTVACGGGGGSGGGGLEAGPAYWGIPFTTPFGASSFQLTLHNLRRSDTSATYTSYAYDGTPTGGGVFALDGFHAKTIEFAGTPTVAWMLVETPSGGVEVSFAHVDASGPVHEAHRGFPLGDLMAPPPLTTHVIPVVLPATTLRISNASAAAAVVTVDVYPTPVAGQDATLATTTMVPLAPFETTVIDPDALTPDFLGQLHLSSASPFFAATTEGLHDLAIAGDAPVFRRDRVLHTEVAFGLDHGAPTGFTDFALVLSNVADESRDVVLRDVRRLDGSPMKLAPRTISLGAHETRAISTMEAPFADLFGDALLAPGLTRARLELFVPQDVDVAARQFDPVVLQHLGTSPLSAPGHVIDVLGVESIPTPTTHRQWLTIHNPNATAATIDIASLIPQPTGFDSGPTLLTSVTVPAKGSAVFSPDGTNFLDRDASSVPFLSLRLTSPLSFAMSARHERRTESGLLIMISPLIVRSHDDAH